MRRLELRGEMIGARARGGGVLVRAVPARFGFGGVATKRLSLSLSRRLLRRRFAQLSTRRLELRGEMIGARARAAASSSAPRASALVSRVSNFVSSPPRRALASAASRRSVSASISAAAFSAAASRNSPRVASSCAER